MIRIAVRALAALCLCVAEAKAAPLAAGPADGHFRRLTASDGLLANVDVSQAVVRQGGAAITMAAIAQAAAQAEPAALANQPNGFAQLGANGVIPANLLPVAYSSSSALAASSLGQPSGPARLDSSAALSANVSAAGAGSVARALSAHFADTLDAADYGVVCDGATDTTSALKSAFAAYQNSGRATRMILPTGTCMLSSEIDVTVGSSLMLSGGSFSGTRLNFTTPSNGLVFTLYNASDLTLRDFRISKTVAANPASTEFANVALSISPFASATANGGQVTIADLGIMGESENPTVGWSVGVKLVDLHTPSLYDVKVFQPPALTGTSNAALMGAPEPGQSGATTPAGLANLVGDGIYFGGSNDFLVDISIVDCLVDGGIVGFDMGPSVQGVYGLNNRAVYNDYGLRGEANGTLAELVNWSNGLFNDDVAGIYLNGVNENALSNNLLLHNEGGGPGWNAIWLRNEGWSTISGNNIVALYSQTKETENGIEITSDGSGGASGQPNTITGNTLQGIQGSCINIDQNSSAVAVTGNALHLCGGSYIWDHSGGGARIGNFIDGGKSVQEDSLGNLAVHGGITANSVTSAGNLSAGGLILRSGSSGIAATGTSQANSAALPSEFDVITSCPSGAGVSLPASAPGSAVKVLNRSGAACLVYPKGADAIERGTAAVTIAAGADIEFVSVAAGQWYE